MKFRGHSLKKYIIEEFALDEKIDGPRISIHHQQIEGFGPHIGFNKSNWN